MFKFRYYYYETVAARQSLTQHCPPFHVKVDLWLYFANLTSMYSVPELSRRLHRARWGTNHLVQNHLNDHSNRLNFLMKSDWAYHCWLTFMNALNKCKLNLTTNCIINDHNRITPRNSNLTLQNFNTTQILYYFNSIFIFAATIFCYVYHCAP